MTTTREAPIQDRRPPCVGIVGGLGPLAGAHFYRRLVELTPAARDEDHIGVILMADPGVPSRLAHLGGQGPSPGPRLARMAHRLVVAGATLVALPSSTTHAYYDEVAQSLSVPLLHLPTIVGQAVADRGWQRVGIMATTPTLTLGLYEGVAHQHDVRLRYPDPDTQTEIMAIIACVKRGELHSDLGVRMESLRQRAWADDTDGVVLGCTEIPVVYPACASSPLSADRRVMAATDELARAVIRACGRTPR